MPCLYATTIMAHSRAHLAFAALSTERTSAGSKWVIDGLDCLRVFGAAGIWFFLQNATLRGMDTGD
jgi:hypothetical protein